MLTSITPLGERGRGHRWPVTAGWLIIGHVAGGLALGVALSTVGWTTRRAGIDPGESTATLLIGAVVLAAAAFDLSGHTILGRRQVDERWLGAYRGWVYGSGFGLQLGFGLVTVVNTALVAALLVAGALVPVSGALLLGCVYGLVRGIGATANGWVRSVADLRRLHRWLDGSEDRARWVGATVGVAAAVAGVAIT
jgi:hypothetical protein